jgi:glycosyltransferase 2 family protein
MTVTLKQWFPIAFFSFAAIFLGLYVSTIDYGSISRLKLNWWLLVASTLLAISYRYWGVLVWRVILSELGATSLPSFRVLSSVYAKAWMGRYIPGKVTWIAGKVYLASGFGISKSRLAVASILEGGVQITAVLAISMILLGLDPRLDVIPRLAKIVMVVTALFCLGLLYPAIFNRLAHAGYLIIKKRAPGPELRINGRAVTKSLLLYSAGALISGTSFYVLASAVDPAITSEMALYLVGAYSMSGAIGMATPLLPSGVGVRDGVLLVLLTIAMPAEIAVALTVLSRLWSAIVDILYFAFATAVVKCSPLR